MNNHSETHYHRPRFTKDKDRVPCISIKWEGWGYGIDRCNQHAERIVGGLRYSTRTATLVAALDGEDFGAYFAISTVARRGSSRCNASCA